MASSFADGTLTGPTLSHLHGIEPPITD